MADALFRYLLMARARDRSLYRRLLLSEDQLLAAGLVRPIETASIRVEVVEHYERSATRPSGVMPASQLKGVQFYRSPKPPAWPEEDLRLLAQHSRYLIGPRVPLAGTVREWNCTECSKGRVRCPLCQGPGSFFAGRETPRTDCGRCAGSGRVKHDLCAGEGRLVAWDERVFEYVLRRSEKLFWPRDLPDRVLSAAEALRREHEQEVLDPSPEAVARQLGYYTPELATVVSEALGVREEPAPPAWSTQQRHKVTHRTWVMPIVGCRVLSNTGNNTFWLVGRGAHAVEVPPDATLDGWKVAALSGLASAGGLMLASSTTGALLTGALGMSAAALRARQMLGSGARVRVVAVLPCNGQRSTYLTCLGVVGSLAGKIEVVDHTYREGLQQLMFSGQPPNHSQSMAVKTKDGTIVRLIESRTSELASHDLARMSRAVDGILYLADPQRPKELLTLQEDLAAERPREAVMKIGRGEGVDPSGQTPDGCIDLEAIRKTFIREQDLALDWALVFEALWKPIAEALSAGR